VTGTIARRRPDALSENIRPAPWGSINSEHAFLLDTEWKLQAVNTTGTSEQLEVL
jgi:hypothetical protein